MLLNPWALFFLAAVGMPLAIHFLTRPRPVVLPSSTLRFVREVIQQRRARHWLRDLLTLLFRMAAIALVVLAVARPRSSQLPAASIGEEDSDAVRIVLLDNSLSMSAVDGGTSLFERARAVAADQLRYRPNLRANLILVAAQPRAIFEQPSQNFEALRNELATAGVLPERADVARALAMAAEMLAPRDADDLRQRELVIVSDFQRTSWAQADFSVLPRETKITLDSAAARNKLTNLGISAARIVGQTEEGTNGRIEIDVGNWSPTPRAISVEVQIGNSTRMLTGECPAGRQTTLTDDFALSDLGWYSGSAKLVFDGDALAADDVLPLAVEVRPRPTYLLISRQPATLRPSSSHFLECALSPEGPSATSRGTPAVVRATPDALDAEMLSQANLIVIDHPGVLNPAIVQMLAQSMRRGRSILFFAAETADAITLQRLTAEMGRSLKMPVAYQPFPQGQWRRDQQLSNVRLDLSPFNALGEGAAVLVKGWRFGGGLASHPVPETLADEVLATYTDGSACLALTVTDSAALAVMNADLGTSNLPTQSAFVPLIDELTRSLTERRSATQAPRCGQSLVARLPTVGLTASSLTIDGPNSLESKSDLGELQDEGGNVIWRWPAVGAPGVYRIRNGSETVFSLAVSIPAEESNLEPLSPDVLQNRLVGENSVYYRDAQDDEQSRDSWWTWLLVGCLACMLSEMGTLLVFRT